ncbi:class I SAM-dependent methyltransferase [Ktedonosporobacter rubrisoli]|uniref:Class I SAM-dependent methyltransferase n=1 Tax=Ktedonosporobacter rubrisoli TaxID=2509675 RepID=A0A4P6K381_KTERU|nr:class I SAM-dependent methyltransferase [Ktedonosporobacter rubrisoli]QBD82708.1 class I SAM-dependent methyltransferase [Ktedonosporobacter rubrisoli]
MQAALERWHYLIDKRAQQMDEAYARLGRSSADFWNRRARSFHQATKDNALSDPFFLKVRQAVTAQSSVLDVGAGTGRFALALAPLAKQVVAVEPNSAMLSYLRQEAEQKCISNLSYIATTWQEAATDVQADIVVCSHVLYPLREVDTFLAKLDRAARQACYIYLHARHFDELTGHLWRHFHGSERCLSPSYIHALDVMYEMGIYANVEVVSKPPSWRYHNYEVAVEELIEQLILPDNERTRTELRRMLEAWLWEKDGMLVPPVSEMSSAIVYWQR